MSNIGLLEKWTGRQDLLGQLLEIEKFPELHLISPSGHYNFCGPYTKLRKRLRFNSDGSIKKIVTQPINRLDRSCMLHDIAYLYSKDPMVRFYADKKLYDEADDISATSDSIFERLDAMLTKKIIQSKTSD